MASLRLHHLLIILIGGLTAPNVSGALLSTAMSGAQDDASDITWAHGVNSLSDLDKALESRVDFLEADVVIGHVTGSEHEPPIPVMAHPPKNISDISLNTWLSTVATRASNKGLKLDFKSLEVVEPSLMILEMYASKLNGSLWLSADVLSGPVRSPMTPVPADQFLALCNKYLPNAVLSLGWTTYWFRKFPINTWHYEWKHVRQMADLLRCRYADNYPSTTFSVRAIFASRSIKQLQWLLNTIPRSSLRVWSANGDPVNVEDISRIQKAFENYKIYYVIPEIIKPPFKQKYKKRTILDSNRWISVVQEEKKSCDSFTYTDSNSILFGKSSNILVLQQRLISVDASNFTLTGRMKFFAGEHIMNPTHWEHKLKIVLAELNSFPKNAISYSKKKLKFIIRDPGSLWSVVNSSVLYTFEHQYFQDSSACRMFKLDISRNMSFQAWTIPCDDTYDDTPLEDVAERSISEIFLEERLGDTDGNFIVGFYSYGEEFVLLYDLNVTGQEKATKLSLNVPQQHLALTSSGTILTHSFMFIVFYLVFVSLFSKNYFCEF